MIASALLLFAAPGIVLGAASLGFAACSHKKVLRLRKANAALIRLNDHYAENLGHLADTARHRKEVALDLNDQACDIILQLVDYIGKLHDQHHHVATAQDVSQLRALLEQPLVLAAMTRRVRMTMAGAA
jgi:predicted MPP superfamily phosphohydrolase